jgi:hypothetical protein
MLDPPMTKRAIVTLAIGPNYAERFEQFCRKDWTAYAERHGFDLIVIKEPLDASERSRKRSPAWQKCLILSAPDMAAYERVVWVDSDICIDPKAPSILEGVPAERIGAIDEHRYPTPELRQIILESIIAAAPDTAELGRRYWQEWRDASVWHAGAGLPGGQAHIVQTGVLVLSPKHHRELLEHVYYAYDEGGPNYEMRPLSHEIQARGLQHWIDPRFNALVWWMFLHRSMAKPIETQSEMRNFLLESYTSNYFLHFAGCAHLMPLLASVAGHSPPPTRGRGPISDSGAGAGPSVRGGN